MADMPSIGYQRQHVYLNQLDGLKTSQNHDVPSEFSVAAISTTSTSNMNYQGQRNNKKQVKGIDSNFVVCQEQADFL